MARRELSAQIIDGILDEGTQALALSAAVHVGLGRVKMTAEVLAKGERHPLGGILDAVARDDEDDPLRTAALLGIALALDTGRNLGRAARCWPRNSRSEHASAA
jgi:hypothetical protein